MDDILSVIPEEVFGIPTFPFVGLVIGILLAVSEATRTKYLNYALKLRANGKEVTFNRSYLVTTVIGVLVVVLTVMSVKDTAIISTAISNDVSGLITVMMAGFTEGWAVIRTLNTRLDNIIKKKAVECGVSKKDAEAIADAVEFVEVSPKEESPKSVSFEEL